MTTILNNDKTVELINQLLQEQATSDMKPFSFSFRGQTVLAWGTTKKLAAKAFDKAVDDAVELEEQ